MTCNEAVLGGCYVSRGSTFHLILAFLRWTSNSRSHTLGFSRPINSSQAKLIGANDASRHQHFSCLWESQTYVSVSWYDLHDLIVHVKWMHLSFVLLSFLRCAGVLNRAGCDKLCWYKNGNVFHSFTNIFHTPYSCTEVVFSFKCLPASAFFEWNVLPWVLKRRVYLF